MNTKLISIIIGLVLVLGTGTLVYKTKQSAYIAPVDTTTTTTTVTQTVTTPAPTTVKPIPTTIIKGESDDDDEDEGGTVKTTPVTTEPAPAPATTPASQPTTSSGITLTQVAQHATRASCWSAVNGNVYDLTSWIPNHPGGEGAILSMCGIDGSAGYNGQHGGSKKTTTILGGFILGALAK